VKRNFPPSLIKSEIDFETVYKVMNNSVKKCRKTGLLEDNFVDKILN